MLWAVRIAASFALLIALGASTRPQAATYAFDSRHANVSFTYRAGVVPQSGHFTALAGQFQFDPKAPDPGSITAVIKTSSLSASAFESELKGSDFFNVAVFPEIRFKSLSVKQAGEDSAEFAGDLTMVGVTKRVRLHAKLTNDHHVSARMQIKRSDFNMTAYGFLVGDEIDIRIEADLTGQKTSG